MHFAAHAYVGESVQNPRKYFRQQCRGRPLAVKRMHRRGVNKIRFLVHLRGLWQPPKVPISEDSPRQPANPYGVTKLMLEYALESYARAYGLRFAALRYFNAAGADESGEIGELHDPETHLIPLALQTAAGKKSHLEIFGTDYPTADGTCIRDYIHVNDLADAHVRALEYLRGKTARSSQTWGQGPDTPSGRSSIPSRSVTGRKVAVHLGPRRAGDPPELVADPARARKAAWAGKRSARLTESLKRPGSGCKRAGC